MENIIVKTNKGLMDLKTLHETKRWDELGYIPAFGHDGLLEVQRIDELDLVLDDEEAVEQAVKDGFLYFIPVKDIPVGYQYRWLGYLECSYNRDIFNKMT